MPGPDLSEFEELQEVEELRAALFRTQRQLREAKKRNEQLVIATVEAARDAMLAHGPIKPVPPVSTDRRKGKPEVALWHLTDWQGSRNDCHHAEGNDPRCVNRCVKCEALMFEPRDLDFERAVIESACRGRVDPEDLIVTMQRRAERSEHGSDRIRIGVDWLREASEELPDFANYLTWALRTLIDTLDDESKGQLHVALMEAASAFNRVQFVRARLNGVED